MPGTDYGASTGDIRGRVPYRTIDANTTPSAANVKEWLDEAEAMINGALQAAEIAPVPITSDIGVKILKKLTVDYAEGRTRKAFAASGGDGSNEDGQVLCDAFEEAIESIIKNPAIWDAKLNGSATASTRRMLGTPTDDVDGRATDSDGFKPRFTKADYESQF